MEYNHQGYITTDHPSKIHAKFSKQAWTKREDSLKKAMTIQMVKKISCSNFKRKITKIIQNP